MDPHPLDDTADDWADDDLPLTQVLPSGFVAPCERCGGCSLGDRFCPDCECELERWLP